MKMVKRALAAGAALTTVLASSPAFAGWGDLNLRVGATPLSREIYGLHMLVLWICVAIAVAVFSVMIYSIATFRRSKGAVPASFDHSTTAEIIWTVIPVGILVFMAIPAARTLVRIDDTRGSDMTIRATGYQWKWQYEYVDQGISFFSTLAQASNEARQLHSNIDPKTVDNYLLDVDNPLVVPAGKKIRMLITSADVIHSWWLPDFAIKKDAIPGYINEMWFEVDKPGTYRGQCVELCGRDHGFMPIVVVVLEPSKYDAWVAQQKTAREAAVAADARVAQLNETTLRVANAE
ncbi:MAG TPA: cytochrome c oxidase subunit II [Steroidobacteraceae bacterium]|nr:cytochrome c oxidase subunit II [Steroidobacteraceae bacterium]